MPLRLCAVSFVDVRGIRHVAEVHAQSLYEAAILAARMFKAEPWIENIGPATPLDIEIREPTTKHSITLGQVERWLESTSASPNEMMKRTKLRQLLTP